MNKKNIAIFIFIVLLLVVCYFIGENNNTTYANTDEFTEEEQEELNEITVDEYLKLKEGKDLSIIYIARPTCSHCVVQTPRMKYIKYKYQLEINYLNTDNFSTDNTDYEKMERMDQAVDKIRKKYGKNAIMRASFLDNKKVDHMTGGHPDGGQVNLKTLKERKK